MIAAALAPDSAQLQAATFGDVIRIVDLAGVLAVGCWAAVGAQKALAADLGWLPAILLGMVAAIGGGMVRDLFLMKVPTVFGGNTLYATSAFVASVEMVVLNRTPPRSALSLTRALSREVSYAISVALSPRVGALGCSSAK